MYIKVKRHGQVVARIKMSVCVFTVQMHVARKREVYPIIVKYLKSSSSTTMQMKMNVIEGTCTHSAVQEEN